MKRRKSDNLKDFLVPECQVNFFYRIVYILVIQNKKHNPICASEKTYFPVYFLI